MGPRHTERRARTSAPNDSAVLDDAAPEWHAGTAENLLQQLRRLFVER
jgi:hypothetical protein